MAGTRQLQWATLWAITNQDLRDLISETPGSNHF